MLEIAQVGEQVPVVELDVVLLPWLGDRVADPGQVLAQVRVAGDGEDAESIEDAPGEGLELGVQTGPALAEERVQVLARAPVADGEDPGEVVQPGGADIHPGDDLALDLLLGGGLVGGGLQAGQLGRDGQAQVLGQCHADHHIAGINLVAQPDRSDAAVAVDRVADADHRIGEVDEPGVRAGLLHVARDFHHRAEVARRVGKAARAAIFGVRLSHAVLERDLEILPPQTLARPDLDGRDDETSTLQRLGVVGVGGDGQPGVPLAVEAFGQAPDDLQVAGVAVDQGQVAAAQGRAFLWITPAGADQGGERVFPEGGAACTDDDDFGWKGHITSLDLHGWVDACLRCGVLLHAELIQVFGKDFSLRRGQGHDQLGAARHHRGQGDVDLR